MEAKFTIEEVRQIVREVLVERAKRKKNGRVKKRKYHGTEYKASAGSLARTEDPEAFAWARNPWAAKNAAEIVKTGHPIVKKGSKKKK
jgi:hypothetical protein